MRKRDNTGYVGASSSMEYHAAKAMAKRLRRGNFRLDQIITDRDGKIFKAFKKFYPDIRVMHCSAHMLKNFRKKIRNSDVTDDITGKKIVPSLKSMYLPII